MSDSASWWKNSAMLIGLMSIPLVVSLLPLGSPDGATADQTNGTQDAEVVADNGDIDKGATDTSPRVAQETPELTAPPEGAVVPATAVVASAETQQSPAEPQADATAEAPSEPSVDAADDEASSAAEPAAEATAEAASSETDASQEPDESKEPEESPPAEPGADESPASQPAVVDAADGDPDFAAWQRDVDERIQQSVLSEILVTLADHNERLDNRVLELQDIEMEVASLRRRLEYLHQLKSEWEQR